MDTSRAAPFVCLEGPVQNPILTVFKTCAFLLLAYLVATSLALFTITLRLPYYAQAKAFYILSAIVPLSIVAALGLAWVPERLAGRWPAASAIYSGWLGTLAATILLAFLG